MNRKNRRKQNGQVFAEYAAMLVMAVSVALTLFLLMAAFSEYGWRLTFLLGWEPWE